MANYDLSPATEIPLTGPPLGRLWNLPAAPAHTIERSEILNRARVHLLSPPAEESTQPPLCVLQGVSGSGKTTLALILARDVRLRAHFRDGVYWLPLGAEPDLLALLSELLTLWIPGLSVASVEHASVHLGRFLAEKRALLILDDVRAQEQIAPFLPRIGASRVLLTTDRLDPVPEIPAQQIPVGSLKPEQALQLAATLLGRDLESPESREVRRFARTTGNLPLPLSLTVASLQANPTTWEEATQALRAQRAHVVSLPSHRRLLPEQLDLEIALRGSLQRLQTEDDLGLERFAALGLLAEQAVLTPSAASMLWQVDPATAAALLTSFHRWALLQADAPLIWVGRREPVYRLHPVLHAAAHRLLVLPSPDGLGRNAQQEQRDLLQRYWEASRPHTSAGDWSGLPIDGYIHTALVQHLERAGQYERIEALLREETAAGRNAWFQIRASLGQITGYASDLRRALKLAHERSCRDHTPGTAITTLGAEVRFLFMLTSVNSLRSALPADTIVPLLQAGILSPLAALSAVRQLDMIDGRQWPYEGRPDKMLTTLAPLLPVEVLPEALLVARGLFHYHYCWEALHAIALTLATRGDWEQALAATRNLDSPHDSFANLESLVPALIRAGDRAAALRTLHTAPEPRLRSHLLNALASRMTLAELRAMLPEIHVGRPASYWCYDLRVIVSELARRGKLKEAAALIDKIDLLRFRADAFVALALVQPDLEERARNFGEALAAARRERDLHTRSRLHAYIAARMAATGQTEEALQVARQVERDFDRVDAIQDISQFLRTDQLPQACAIVRERTQPYFQALALGRLAVRMPDPTERRAVLAEACSTAKRIDPGPEERYSGYIAHVLEELVSFAEAAGWTEEAIAVIREMEDETTQDLALQRLALSLAKAGKFEEAHPVLQEVKDYYWRDRALREIESMRNEPETASLPSPQRPKRLSPRRRRQLLLETLTNAYRIEIRPELLQAPTALAELLADLAPHLTPPQIRALLPSIEREPQIYYRIPALSAVLAHLPDAEERVLRAAAEWQRYDTKLSSRDWSFAVSDLAPYLTETQRQRALMVALKRKELSQRVEALQGIAPHLTTPQVRAWAISRVLKACCAVRAHYTHFHGLRRLEELLAPLIAGGHAVETLAEVRKMADAEMRYEALRELAPTLSDPAVRAEVVQEMLAAASTLETPAERARAFCLTAPLITDLAERARVLSKALASARQIEDPYSRTEPFTDLAMHLIDPGQIAEAVTETLAAARVQRSAAALGRVAAAIPDLAERTLVLEEALAMVEEIIEAEFRVRALHDIAPRLTSERLQEALTTMWLEETYPLHQELLQRALQSLRADDGPPFCLRWAAFLRFTETLPRQHLLPALAELVPILKAHGDAQTLPDVIEALQDVMRWW